MENFKLSYKSFTFSQLILSLSLIIFYSCNSKPSMPPPGSIAVTAMTIETQNIPAYIEYVGVAQSSNQVEIRARVEGYLQKIVYHEGDLVHANELLFEIDPKPFEASLDQAKANQEQQEAILWEAERSVARLEPLYEKKAASRRDLDIAIAQQQSNRAAVNAAKAQVVQAELNLGYTKIHSPITGVSSQSKFRVGALVSPGNNSLLTTVTALDPIWVNFNVSEGDLLKFHQEVTSNYLQLPKGMDFDIEIELANGVNLPTKGKVDFADPSLQQNTGSMIIRAVLPNPHEMLRPGQFVRAKLIGAIHPNAIAIPQRSVMQSSKGMFVYILDKEDKAEMRPIEVGDWYNKDWIIKSGLKAGERVIVDGVNKVMPGMKVIVQNSPVEKNS